MGPPLALRHCTGTRLRALLYEQILSEWKEPLHSTSGFQWSELNLIPNSLEGFSFGTKYGTYIIE